MFSERDLKIQKLISGAVLITAGGSDFFVKKNKGGGGGAFIRDLRVGGQDLGFMTFIYALGTPQNEDGSCLICSIQIVNKICFKNRLICCE